MKLIDVKTTVHPDGSVTAHVPTDVPPGEHLALLIVDGLPVAEDEGHSVNDLNEQLGLDVAPLDWLPLSTFKIDGWSSNSRFRREDLYSNDGR